MTARTAAELERLYDVLARWQCLQRRLRGAAPGDGYELRKRLAPAPASAPPGSRPTDGAAGLDAWMQQRVGTERVRGARVLDLGCGFGASLRRWLAAGAASAVGVTRSVVQARVAARETARCGLGERAVFSVQDFEAPLPGPFDVVLAIESFGHASDLEAVLRHVGRALAPGGTLVWVEDLLAARTDADEDVQELATRWASPPLRDVAAAEAALAAAGLHVVEMHDLTAQVVPAPPAALAARAQRLSRWRRLLPSRRARALLDAFLGGIALERLYARGLVRYRAVLARRQAVRGAG